MKWIDFYLILVITLILRLTISNNFLFILSCVPTGVILGHLRAKANLAEAYKKRDDK